jgi:hypothetical protein
MDEQQAKLNHLDDLFTGRKATYDSYTQQIIDALNDTALQAVAEVLEVNLEDLDVQSVTIHDETVPISDASVVLSMIVQYDDESDIPAFLQAMTPELDEGEDPTTRIVRIAIPYIFCLESKDTIRGMLLRTLINAFAEEDDLDQQADDEIRQASQFIENELGECSTLDSRVDASSSFLMSFLEQENKGKIH